jgi:hypothetical protein
LRQSFASIVARAALGLIVATAAPALAFDSIGIDLPDGAIASSPMNVVDLPPVTTEFTCRACPDARVEFRELEAARAIDWKLALAAAMRAASRSDGEERRFGQPRADGSYVFANSPKEVAEVLRNGLGPTSLFTHGADAIASLADAAERTTQVPLDGINYLSDTAVEAGRRLGWRRLPRFRLRSKIENDRAGITLTARW